MVTTVYMHFHGLALYKLNSCIAVTYCITLYDDNKLCRNAVLVPFNGLFIIKPCRKYICTFKPFHCYKMDNSVQWYLQELSCYNVASLESWFHQQGFHQHRHTNSNQQSHNTALPHNCHLPHTAVQSVRQQGALVFLPVSGCQGLQVAVSDTWKSLYKKFDSLLLHEKNSTEKVKYDVKKKKNLDESEIRKKLTTCKTWLP